MSSIPAPPSGQRAGGRAHPAASGDVLPRSLQRPPGLDGRLIFRLLLAVDIEGYSARSPRMQLQAQADLRHALERAAGDAGLDRGLWVQQHGGDGELAVLPEDADIVQVVGAFTTALQAALAESNGAALPGHRLRVRLALHYGALILGGAAAFGPAGDAPVVVSRLLDARPLRRYLSSHPERDIALIVSDVLYKDVICSGFCVLAPEDFQQVRTSIKKIVYQGYIYAPAPVGEGKNGKAGDQILAADGVPAELSVQSPATRFNGRCES